MTRSIRHVAVGVAAALAVLLGASVWQQAIAGPRYRDDLRNPRAVALAEDRGRIITGDGAVVAESITTETGVVRRYPSNDLYGHPVGHATRIYGATGVEESAFDDLRVPPANSVDSLITRLLGDPLTSSDVVVTLDDQLQRVAFEALGDQRGAVVALDVRDGAILAWASTPSYDPNVLAGPNALGPGDLLSRDDALPLVDRGRSMVYPPGSTFKILVAAAALESGMTPDTRLRDLVEYTAPGTERPIRNFLAGSCRGNAEITLLDALVVSCNTVFAALGVDLGAEALTDTTRQAGFGAQIPFDLDTEKSFIPGDLDTDLPALAQSAIGGRDVRVTPLHMALIAAAISSGGQAPVPRLIAEVRDGDETTTTRPTAWKRLFSEDVSADIRAMMIEVVERGTGTAARVDGVAVGGKTGTAEVPGAAPHTWFVAFAEDEGRSIAIAVVVENGGSLGADGTGGRVAAPIARSVIEAWVEGPS